MVFGMKDYIKKYDDATQKLLAQAAQIDAAVLPYADVQYTLYDITYTLRKMYKNHAFRDKFVGDMPFNGFVPWTKGFCALSSICIYELYGGDAVWEPSAIKLGAWEHAPVVYLRNRFTDTPFDTTGDQFAPLRVPYELGTPINRPMHKMNTPNKTEFVKRIITELDRR